MSRKIYLSESQFNRILQEEYINESMNDILKKVAMGAMSATAAISLITGIEFLSQKIKDNMREKIIEVTPNNEWEDLNIDLKVTVYNAVPSQCNKDVEHTASMFRIDTKHPESHKIIALERTLAQRFGLKYGDLIKIEGTYGGKQDGVYQFQDLMNKRFAGQEIADILVDNSTKYGGTIEGSPAKMYVLRDTTNASTYRLDMAPEYRN